MVCSPDAPCATGGDDLRDPEPTEDGDPGAWRRGRRDPAARRLVPARGPRAARRRLVNTATPRPGVVVIHEAIGLNDDIRRIATRFAAAGYVTLAPDFLAGLGPMPFCIARFARGIGRVRVGRPYRQLAAAEDWLRSRPEVAGSPIGVAGFCMGGGFALLHAVGADIDVVAPFYAAVPRDGDTLAGVCPVVASYGGRDGMFGSGGGRLEIALTRLGVDHDVKTYPDAGHSFMSRHGGLIVRDRAAPADPRRLRRDGGARTRGRGPSPSSPAISQPTPMPDLQPPARTCRGRSEPRPSRRRPGDPPTRRTRPIAACSSRIRPRWRSGIPRPAGSSRRTRRHRSSTATSPTSCVELTVDRIVHPDDLARLRRSSRTCRPASPAPRRSATSGGAAR